jgi:anthranilate synthase component 1
MKNHYNYGSFTDHLSCKRPRGIKPETMQLIEGMRKPTEVYGGAIGFMDFESNFNHAIMIHYFLSKIINYILKQRTVSLYFSSDEN